MGAARAVLDAEVIDVEAKFAQSRRCRCAGKAGADYDDVEVALVGGIDKFLMGLVVGPLFGQRAFGDLRINLIFRKLRRFDVGVVLHDRGRVNHTLEILMFSHNNWSVLTN